MKKLKKKNSDPLAGDKSHLFDGKDWKHLRLRFIDKKLTPQEIKAAQIELKRSFESIFPELIKPTKHRKHVIFDADVFMVFESLAGDSGSNFSALINSALRSFIQERLKRKSAK
jgi:hypothetical protein